MAFILAGVAVVITLGLAALLFGAAMMSDAPSMDGPSGVVPVLVVGFSIAALLAGSHWVHISW